MKKYILVLSILSLILLVFLGFNVKSTKAYDSGCIGSGPYSITTGQFCDNSQYGYSNYNNYYNNYSYGCTSTGPFNIITGQLCDTLQYSNSYQNTYPYYNQTSTIYGSSSYISPVISSISTSSGRVGNQVTLYGRGFNNSVCNAYTCLNNNNFSSNSNTINFGLSIIPNAYSADGTTLTFTIPAYTNSSCQYSTPACVIPQYQIIPSTYPIFVTNLNGVSNVINFTVTY
jgi:hypothetical protein